MMRVLNNLIDNSVKYSNKRNVEVKLSLSKKDKIILIYNDNGPGVKEENINKLFDEFYREDDSRNSKVKGSGLGLFIVKQIINMHNGNVYVRNNNGFELEIQLEEANEKDINS